MGTILLFAFLTYFSGLVASRASRLNRNPWLWFFLAWLATPILAWLILELTGPKNCYMAFEQNTMVSDQVMVSEDSNNVCC